MPLNLGERCMECGYSLRGLPCPHVCPECGTPYDEHRCKWTFGRHRRLMNLLVLTGLAIVVVGSLNLLVVLGFGVRGRTPAIVINVGWALIAAFAWPSIEYWLPSREARVTQAGVVLRGMNYVATLDWNELRSVSRRGRRVWIVWKGPWRRLRRSCVWGTAEEARQFAEVVERARERGLASAPAQPA